MIQTPSGTLTERYERGKCLRKKVAREKHADLRGRADRTKVDYEQLVKAKGGAKRKAT